MTDKLHVKIITKVTIKKFEGDGPADRTDEPVEVIEYEYEEDDNGADECGS